MPPPLLIEAGPSTIVEEEEQEQEEEDSFFELEIDLPYSLDISIDSTRSVRQNKVEEDELNSGISAANDHGGYKSGIFQQRCVPASPGEKSFSKRKILPFEGLHRPQSPISLLKSAPKFRVFMFAESKSTAAAKKETGMKQGRNRGSPLLALKFKVKEIQPFFARSGSLRTGRKESSSDTTCGHCSDDSVASKRFSRDVIQKYLRFVKPLYVKASKKQDNSETFAEEFPAAAASASPPLLAGSGKPPVGTLSKHLGKSRSASAATSLRVVSPARMDDSLLQQHDGIQSAILHCKRSFSASRDFSPLSCDVETIDMRIISMAESARPADGKISRLVSK